MDKDIVDPDGEVNLARKRKTLGVAEETDPVVNDEFPLERFTCGVSVLPRISFSHIWRYLIEEVELRKKLSTEKPIAKGYNFYKSGHVRQIFSKKEGGKFFIKRQVLPSMKKGKVYTVKAVLHPSGDIAKAVCGCPAGVDGRCNHLAATLFAIEDQWDNVASVTGGISQPQNSIPYTSQPCQWNLPSKRKLNPEPIQSLKFAKHEYGKEKKRSSRDQIDVRAPHQRNISDSELKLFYEEVKLVEKVTSKKIGLSSVLPHRLPNSNDQEPEPQPSDNALQKWRLVSPEKLHPMSVHEISFKADKVKQRLFNSGQEQEEIEKATRDQHTSILWYNIRRPRITASQTKSCLLKDATSPTKAISEVLMYKPSIQTRLMKEGIEMEPKIIERFCKEMGNVVKKCGYFILETHPFLGASPDGITDKGFLVEVKKVTSKYGESMETTLCRLGIYKQSHGNISLNKNHKYFYQIQQQQFCSKKKQTHFIISNGVWLHHELVVFDGNFWQGTRTKLEQFYFKKIFPEVVYPRVMVNLAGIRSLLSHMQQQKLNEQFTVLVFQI